jgi:hypothetical protein
MDATALLWELKYLRLRDGLTRASAVLAPRVAAGSPRYYAVLERAALEALEILETASIEPGDKES